MYIIEKSTTDTFFDHRARILLFLTIISTEIISCMLVLLTITEVILSNTCHHFVHSHILMCDYRLISLN